MEGQTLIVTHGSFKESEPDYIGVLLRLRLGL